MSGMRFTPRGFGGHRRRPDAVTRDGWREQGILAVAADDARLTARREALRQADGGAAWLSGPGPMSRRGFSRLRR